MNFKGKDYISHVPQRLAGMDECMDNFCKQRAECLHHSFVIVHTERGQWQASFKQEKSARLADFTKISKFPEILGQLSMHKQCVPGFFSPPTHESLGLRLTYVILVFISGEDLVTSPAA